MEPRSCAVIQQMKSRTGSWTALDCRALFAAATGPAFVVAGGRDLLGAHFGSAEVQSVLARVSVHILGC